jgi:DNA-binding beta-propeller fold protein YncE
MKGAKEGIVVAGGQGQGNSLKQLSNPYGVTVDRLGTLYVGDYKNNRVMCWFNGATQGSVVIGSNDSGDQANQLNGPGGVSLDQQGNLYVVDNHNHRVQKFSHSSRLKF